MLRLKRFAFILLFLCVVRVAYGQDLDIVSRWATKAFSQYSVYPNIVYLRARGHSMKLDVVTLGKPSQVRPTVIFIHGGGWVSGSKENHVLFLLPYLVHGMDAVNVEYELASDAVAPAAVEDCRCALRWVYRHAKDYGFDTSKLVVAGESAGGYLSLMTGMLDNGAGFDNDCPPETSAENRPLRVSAIVDYCGITDVEDLLQGPHRQYWAVRWFGSLPNRMELARQLSPLTYVRQGLPPIIMVHSDADDTVPYQQSVRLHEALTRAGVSNQLVTIHGGKHFNWPLEEHIRAQQAIFEFLEHHGVPAQ